MLLPWAVGYKALSSADNKENPECSFQTKASSAVIVNSIFVLIALTLPPISGEQDNLFRTVSIMKCQKRASSIGSLIFSVLATLITFVLGIQKLWKETVNKTWNGENQR